MASLQNTEQLTLSNPSVSQPKTKGSCEQEDGSRDKGKGLSLWSTVMFLLGELAGSGILALPACLASTGWIGVLVICVCCFAAGTTGYKLGQCWLILQERWTEYNEQVRDPYPVIGERACGRWARVTVATCVNITLFGAATVYLLIASQNLHSLIVELSSSNISFCTFLPIMAACLIPLMLLGSPKDLWWVAVGATCCTSLAAFLIIVGAALDKRNMGSTTTKPIEFQGFFLAFGTMSFAFGGHSIFPTVHHDMKEPAKFPLAIMISFACLLLMYIPVAVAGFAAYGGGVNDNVMLSMSSGGVQYTVQILVTGHLIFAISMILNPPVQHLEKLFNAPRGLSWKRCVIRISLLAFVLFMALSVPHFGYILSLIGGSSTLLLVFVFPGLFYVRLCNMNGPWPTRIVPFHEKAMLLEIAIMGLFGGIGATYSAVDSIVSPNTFVLPCYVNSTAASGS